MIDLINKEEGKKRFISFFVWLREGLCCYKKGEFATSHNTMLKLNECRMYKILLFCPEDCVLDIIDSTLILHIFFTHGQGNFWNSMG